MIEGRKVLVVVPARCGSKGLPDKNIRPLAGKPLLAWPVQAACGCPYVDRVVVSTDSTEYADVARQAGAEVPFLRPAELACDTAASVPVLLHMLDSLEAKGEYFDWIVLLEPTSPMTDSADLSAALERLLANPEAQSIVGVADTEVCHPVFCATVSDNGYLQPYGVDRFGKMPRRQDISPVYFFDGSLYVSTVSALRSLGTFYHDKTLPYIVPKWKAMDIDTIEDFICIEALMNHRHLLS